MCFGGGGDAEKIAKQQRADEVARQNRIKAGMASIGRAFGRFDKGFYNERRKDYVDYAMPDVDRQAGDVRKQLIYALSRTGNLDSSAANEKNAELAAEHAKQRVGVQNEGINQANKLRDAVERTRSGVVAELNATGDASAASASASRAVQNLHQPAGFSPLGNLFLNIANSVSQIGARSGNGYSGFMGGGNQPALYGAPSGSQRVVS